MDFNIRWMKRTERDKVNDMCMMADPSIPQDFLEGHLENSRVVCAVAEFNEEIVGLILYEMNPSNIKVAFLAVDLDFRRNKVATALVERLISKLGGRRKKIYLSVSEYNLDVQLFLRSLGFKATKVTNDSPGHSNYSFIYRMQEVTND